MYAARISARHVGQMIGGGRTAASSRRGRRQTWVKLTKGLPTTTRPHRPATDPRKPTTVYRDQRRAADEGFWIEDSGAA
jgi:hypothetical protein